MHGARGAQLKQHQLFVNLLKLLKGGTVVDGSLLEAFARTMPATSRDHVERVLDALLVLVAWALRDDGQPLVTLRLQLWVRELRRMVSKLSVDPQEVRLRSERDLSATRDGVYLPMLQCSQYRTTGWLSRLVPGGSKLSTPFDEIYNTWFSRRPEAARLYAKASVSDKRGVGFTQFACAACGNVQFDGATCKACAHRELLEVFRVTAQRTQETDHAQYTWHDPVCPGCGERGELLLLGTRNAILGRKWSMPVGPVSSTTTRN
jgi:DEAD/DEAH box helicase domain-containing protein